MTEHNATAAPDPFGPASAYGARGPRHPASVYEQEMPRTTPAAASVISDLNQAMIELRVAFAKLGLSSPIAIVIDDPRTFGIIECAAVTAPTTQFTGARQLNPDGTITVRAAGVVMRFEGPLSAPAQQSVGAGMIKALRLSQDDTRLLQLLNGKWSTLDEVRALRMFNMPDVRINELAFMGLVAYRNQTPLNDDDKPRVLLSTTTAGSLVANAYGMVY